MIPTSQLVAEYNAAAEYLGLPQVKKFQDRKTAERRHAEILAKAEALQAQTEPGAPATLDAEVPVPHRQASNADKVHDAARKFLAARKDEKAATSLRAVLEQFPDITRVQFKHTAISCGYNGLTARNLFDRVRKA